MPNLVGRTLEAARVDPMVRRLELTLADVAEPQPAQPPGVIVRQEIPAGEPVLPGATVRVWVAVAPPPEVPPETRARPMPPLEGRLLRDAIGDPAVTDLQLVLEAQDDPDSNEPPGTIVWQQIPPGEPVAMGATVAVRVARGVVVPRVTGEPLDVARETLERAGLAPDEVRVATQGARVGRVVEQEPPPGIRVARGSRVRITVASAPRPTGRDRSRTRPTSTPPPAPVQPEDGDGWRGLLAWAAGLAGAALAGALATWWLRSRHARRSPPPPEPQVQLRAHASAGTQGLDAGGAPLVEHDVALRLAADAGRQNLAVDGPLAGEERRSHE